MIPGVLWINEGSFLIHISTCSLCIQDFYSWIWLPYSYFKHVQHQMSLTDDTLSSVLTSCFKSVKWDNSVFRRRLCCHLSRSRDEIFDFAALQVSVTEFLLWKCWRKVQTLMENKKIITFKGICLFCVIVLKTTSKQLQNLLFIRLFFFFTVNVVFGLYSMEIFVYSFFI